MSQLFEKIRIKAEEVSGAVTEAAGEVKQAMTEAATQELKSVGEDKLLENANAISKNRAVFEEAGYVVCGMEMELGLNPRVIAHFRRQSVDRADRRHLGHTPAVPNLNPKLLLESLDH